MKNITVILGDPNLPDITKVGHVYSAEDLESVEILKQALAELRDYRFDYWNNHLTLIDDLRNSPPDMVLNFCDTGFKNQASRELELAAYLDLLDIPYTGSGPVALGLCYDKALVRSLAAAVEIPVPGEAYLDMSKYVEKVRTTFPAIIKPNSGDGSVGITANSVVNDEREAISYLKQLRRDWPGRDALIQEFLQGREYGVCLIGNPGHGIQPLPILEVDYSDLQQGLPRILSYESKTVPDSPYWTQIKFKQAAVTTAVRDQLVSFSERLFARLGLRDYARFDYRADKKGTIKLIEVNPNPAWCWDGKMNFMAGFAGHTYTELLQMIVSAAEKRIAA